MFIPGRLNKTMHNLQDKIILVSKRIIDKDGNESFDTYFSKVMIFNENTVIVRKPDGTEESLPYEDDLYELAEDGFYELEDGSTYENPDYIAEFCVYVSRESWKNNSKD